jgi:probable rRNA maturation factor
MISIDSQAQALVPQATALSKAALTRFLNRVRSLVELHGEVELLLTSDAELKRLNRAFRNKNKATDILSFPSPPEIADHHAGDLAISLETAARQAAQFGHTLDEEIRILILHGLLHLYGLDHETDEGEMAAHEAELRATLKLPVSLIARVTTKSASSRPTKAAAKKSPRKKSPRKTVAKPARKRVKS